MMRKIKAYHLKDSPLYKLSSKRKLATLLNCTPGDLRNFNSSREHYRIFPRLEKNKIRICEEPNPALKAIHKKLHRLFMKIEAPEFLISGRKGKSYIDNARRHINNHNFLCMDIKSFYKSARKTFVSNMFETLFVMPNDLALLLADLVTIPDEKGQYSYIPTGSPISQDIAFWTYYKTFSDIQALAANKNISFSLYVDDMTFSSRQIIDRTFEALVTKRLNSVALAPKQEKTKYYSKNQHKLITGCIISSTGKLKIENRKQQELIGLLNQKRLNELSLDECDRLTGHIISQQQIEPDHMLKTYSDIRKRMLHLKLNARSSQP